MHGSERSEEENKDINQVLENRLQDLPEWWEDFIENLADDGVSASRDTPASTSRGSDQERSRKVVSVTTRSAEIASYSRGPSLQGLFADNVRVMQYHEQKIC